MAPFENADTPPGEAQVTPPSKPKKRGPKPPPQIPIAHADQVPLESLLLETLTQAQQTAHQTVEKEEEDFEQGAEEKDEKEEDHHQKANDDTDGDSLTLYYREIRKYPPLTAAEEKALATKFKNEGCPIAKQKMIHHNLMLVIHVAKRFRGILKLFKPSVSFGDLISEGNIGLQKAIERFDPDKGNKISTYATWWIMQSMQTAMQKQGRLIRVPTHLGQKMRRIQRIVDQYHLTLQFPSESSHQNIPGEIRTKNHDIKTYWQGKEHVPSALEKMLKDAGFKVEDLLATNAISSISAPTISLDHTPDSNFGEGKSIPLHESIMDETAKNPFSETAHTADYEEIFDMLASLKPIEKEVLIMRFGLGDDNQHTLEQVGDKFQVTRERIRQIQDKALKKLRKKLSEKTSLSKTNHG